MEIQKKENHFYMTNHAFVMKAEGLKKNCWLKKLTLPGWFLFNMTLPLCMAGSVKKSRILKVWMIKPMAKANR